MAEIIPKNTEKSFGGICLGVIEVLPAQSIILPPDIVRGTYIAPLNVIGNDFEDLFCVRETVQFVEEPIDQDGSELYKGMIRAIVAYDSPERIHRLKMLADRQWIVKFTDQNRQTKLMGKHKAGASFRFSRDSKANIRERSEIEIEFNIIGSNPVPGYPA